MYKKVPYGLKKKNDIECISVIQFKFHPLLSYCKGINTNPKIRPTMCDICICHMYIHIEKLQNVDNDIDGMVAIANIMLKI